MLRTLLCDDERPALDLLSGLLNEVDGVDVVAVCQSAREALALLDLGQIDLAFFDVEMPELSGVEAVRALNIEPRPLIIFATAHPDYAIDAFGIDAIDYILKPFSRERVSKAIVKAQRLHRLIEETRTSLFRGEDSPSQVPTHDVLRVYDAGRLFVIPHDDVVWIEAAGDYSLIHWRGQETAIRRTLTSLARELPEARFKRIHRSSIVSVRRIREIKRLAKGEAEIKLDGDIVLRASRTYSQVIDELIS